MNQNRWIVIGDTGDGKTALANALLYNLYKSGYKVYANLHLEYPHVYIDDTSYIDDVDVHHPNAVLFDEVGEMQSGIHKFSFNNALAQSRKTLGEDQFFIMTTQTKFQTNPTMLSIVSHIVYPEIVKVDKDYCPQVIKAYIHPKIKWSSPTRFEYEPIIKYYNVGDSIKLYDTFEQVKAVGDGSWKTYLKTYARYIGSSGQLKNLSTLISTTEGISLAEGDRKARMIINAKELGLLRKLKLDKDYKKVMGKEKNADI